MVHLLVSLLDVSSFPGGAQHLAPGRAARFQVTVLCGDVPSWLWEQESELWGGG